MPVHSSHLQVPQHNPIIPLPRYAVRLLLFALAAIIVILVSTRWLHLGRPHDPFLPYETIIPGARQEALTDFNCQANRNSVYVSNLTHLCSIVPPDNSVYRRINVTVQNGHIDEVLFYSADLDSRGLIDHWGDPISIERNTSDQRLTLMWDRGSYLVTAIVGMTPGSTVIRLVVLKQKTMVDK